MILVKFLSVTITELLENLKKDYLCWRKAEGKLIICWRFYWLLNSSIETALKTVIIALLEEDSLITLDFINYGHLIKYKLMINTADKQMGVSWFSPTHWAHSIWFWTQSKNYSCLQLDFCDDGSKQKCVHRSAQKSMSAFSVLFKSLFKCFQR